ncbi:adenosine deaminase [Companilactobacillus sp.]|jgi:adenosine deaminase|uniref:adenosine deaminase n=1 Tax=Companilactobacillus sp. TaxID=2767905 RepID=UPI0025BC2D4B|nr:adenosine deaminase [Companilactobacillus sp.]MCH4008662.1 adenosine deaminase [Companilactobacillus sp.]MCH4051159.1 adenosine deaminase [Companilactobacillus sp.]MCH4076605.1 adenosine deaminase [Companilactobacillus sp.]MCH4125180.1 adenosine deaminase [Companilactobacillus sp.]MCH4131720.1 adenosine deaminase [Companilactobacillus sp.]
MLPKRVSREFINGLPKSELHVHLEGTLEPELKLKLAQKNHIDIGQETVEDVEKTYHYSNLASFLAVYYPGMDVLQTEEDFYELAMAYLQKAASQGVLHTEMFFDPQAHIVRGVPLQFVIDGFYQACVDARAFGIDAHLIMCFLRDMSARSAMDLLHAVQPYRNKILGIGLDSDEHHNPPLKFMQPFSMAVEQGYHITMHADVDQIDSIDHIKQALEIINVERLDHGTNIVENKDLVDWVNQLHLGLTSCPLSNELITDNDLKGDEILDLLDEGVKVSINSDDPAYFGGYIADNYAALANEYKVTPQQLVTLAKNSFETAWISDKQKQFYLEDIDNYVEEFEN